METAHPLLAAAVLAAIELWRLPAYLAVVAVAGGGPFGRRYLDRLAAAVRLYR